MESNDETSDDSPSRPALPMETNLTRNGSSRSYQDSSPEQSSPLVENDGLHRYGIVRRRYSWRYRTCLCTTGAVLLLGILLLFFAADAPWKPGWAANYLRQSSSSTCKDNPLLSLKPSATVENLKYGAVASDHVVCSKVGRDILQLYDGNAVDAAVATALCLGVANPASSGIGGGAFILIHSDEIDDEAKKNLPDFIDARESTTIQQQPLQQGKVTEVIDCREIAPAAATTDMFSNLPKNASTTGGLAVAVPGELRGLELAHARHGRLAWRQVVEPAMILARDGVRVTEHLASDIAHHSKHFYTVSDLQYLLTKNNDGRTMLREGDLMTQPELAETLQAIMDDGADALYKGRRAEEIVKEVQRTGGILTTSDLADYRPTLRSPLIASGIRGFSIVGVPPPSSGGAALIGAARFLSGYSNPLASFADTLSKHRIVEAMRHAFGIRMSLGDPSFDTDGTTQNAVKDLVEGDYMESLRKLTPDNSTLPLSMYGGSKWAQLEDHEGNTTAADAQEGDRRRALRDDRLLARRFGYLNDHGTSHLSVIDKDRNAVSITTSLNTYFGSGVYSRSTGLLLNDQMDDFATPGRPNYYGLHPSESNFIQPGKKPLSSMSPTLVFRRNDDDKSSQVFLALGASGGPKIITAVLQVLLNYVLLGMPLFESIVHARLHDQLLYHGSATTTYERSGLANGMEIEVSNTTRMALQRRGHRLLAVDYTGTVQAVAVDIDTDTLTAVSDVRKGGTPDGY